MISERLLNARYRISEQARIRCLGGKAFLVFGLKNLLHGSRIRECFAFPQLFLAKRDELRPEHQPAKTLVFKQRRILQRQDHLRRHFEAFKRICAQRVVVFQPARIDKFPLRFQQVRDESYRAREPGKILPQDQQLRHQDGDPQIARHSKQITGRIKLFLELEAALLMTWVKVEVAVARLAGKVAVRIAKETAERRFGVKFQIRPARLIGRSR